MFAARDDFLVFCEVERRLSPATCHAYRRDVTACLAFLAARGIDELAAVSVRDLRVPGR
jgi:site-specific recombinase XerD